MPTELRLILVWGSILAIAFLYFKPIVMCFILMRKNNAGLSISKEVSEIEGLLQRHPWREEQDLQLIKGEGSGSSFLLLEGFYKKHISVNVRNGILICCSGDVYSPRNDYWEQYEANQLLSYISLLSIDENSPEAARLREQTRIKLANRKERERIQKWLKRIFICVFLLTMALSLLYAVNYAKNKAELPSSLVQNMVFHDFHYTKTVGTALDSFDPDGEWFDVSDKDALKNTGVAYAGWRGTCRVRSLLGTDENWPMTIYFEVKPADEKDKYAVSIDRVEFGQYSLRSNLLQNNGIWDIIDMVYGNRDNASVSADAGLFDVTYFLSKKEDGLPAVSQPTPSPAREETMIISTPVPEPTPVSGGTEEEDRSSWGYEDYVSYYGFDPADYGYYWYNEIKSGPLDEFFDFAAEQIAGNSGSSRLYEDTWITDLTRDDFVGTWQTEGGILFTIDRMGDTGAIEDYTIDLSENEGLGLLGGWFSNDIYNVEEEFCGMSGSSGMTSFSVTYQYSTDSPETNTWLFLELVDSEGTVIQDWVPLVSHSY